MKKFITLLLTIIIVIPILSPASANGDKGSWNLTELYQDEGSYNLSITLIEENIKKLESYKGNLNGDQIISEFIDLFLKTKNEIEKAGIYGILLYSLNSTDENAVLKYEKGQTLFAKFSSSTKFIYDEVIPQDELPIPKDSLSTLNTLLPILDFRGIYSTLTTAELQMPEITRNSEGTITIDGETIPIEGNQRKINSLYYDKIFGAYGKNIYTIAAVYSRNLKLGNALAEIYGHKNSLDMYLESYGITETAYNKSIETANNHLDKFYKLNVINKRLVGIYGNDAALYDIYSARNAFSNTSITYGEARKYITESMAPLGEEYILVVNKAFDENWIDAFPMENKSKGAFTLDAPNHPYILLNFDGTVESTLALAHELGHAVQMYLSKNAKGGDTENAIATAEIASITSEIMFADYMAKQGPDKMRLQYTQNTVDMMANTSYNQIMMTEFEKAVHKEIKENGAVTAEYLNKLWLDLHAKYSGGVYLIPDSAKYGWATVEHFYRDFYTFNYDLSIAAANKILSDAKTAGFDTYLDFLKMSMKLNPMETAKLLFDIDYEKDIVYNYLYQSFDNRLKEYEDILIKNGFLGNSDGSIIINIMGKQVQFENKPYSENYMTMVDANKLAKELSVEFEITPEGIKYGEILIPYTEKDKVIYVHVRKLAEAAGYEVGYIPTSNTVIINK